MKYAEILEQELKNKVENDFFGDFDCTDCRGNIDFAVKPKDAEPCFWGEEYFLWAEAKAASTDILVMLAQLVLTVGKARTFDKILPPHFLGCFDREKFAFVPYFEVQEIFHQNDFDWTVTSSNRSTKEFKLVYDRISDVINEKNTYVFNFEKDENELKRFIRDNFVSGKSETAKIQINKNNFKWVYDKWVLEVKPTIDINWDIAKKHQIFDGDFYLADLISREDVSIKDTLNVLLKSDRYELERNLDEMGLFSSKTAAFNDKQAKHTRFWAKYERPPKEEFWDYMTSRRELLIPQDVRERKGSFFTPQKWVELSQKYIADVLGENWQEEYYVWDCAAGTGNLLVGLTNKYNIWASTLDKADVDVMRDRVKNGANLLDDHVFRFDFLNDEFTMLPKGLRDIIADEKWRKKLIVYINPPYAEDTTKTTIAGTGKNKGGVARNKIHDKYAEILKKANHELFAQFLIRIYKEIPHCKIAHFATLKALCAPNFTDFRQSFKAKLERLFVVPADTFDNVNGQFPIGFHIWDTDKKVLFEEIAADVFDKNGINIGAKKFFVNDAIPLINKWIKKYGDTADTVTGKLCYVGNDFQHKDNVQICSPAKKIIAHDVVFNITKNNLIQASVYFAVRHCIEADWLNDRDQFLYPNDGWKADLEFQNDCLAYTLFHGQNNITSKHGVNHWIPFAEREVNARTQFDSHFMLSFIGGKIIQNGYSDLFERDADKWCVKREFSPEAAAVFDAGRELWIYYHKQPKCDVNASFYDIREHFQGRNEKGKMNNASNDGRYSELLGVLREKLNFLAKKIEPTVYEYGFLKK